MKRNGITIWNMKDLFKSANENRVEYNGKWYPARPYGLSGIRHKLKAIKLILTDKADLVIWPKGQ